MSAEINAARSGEETHAIRHVLVINGPNLNLLGIREPGIYGNQTYCDLENFITEAASELGLRVGVEQSNHEGEIVELIQRAWNVYDAIVINAAAYTHTSVAILDALKAVGLPTVEVHLSDIHAREEFRHFSYISLAAEKTICGHGFEGYREALAYLSKRPSAAPAVSS